MQSISELLALFYFAHILLWEVESCLADCNVQRFVVSVKEWVHDEWLTFGVEVFLGKQLNTEHLTVILH